jgi:hypothetical protein
MAGVSGEESDEEGGASSSSDDGVEGMSLRSDVSGGFLSRPGLGPPQRKGTGSLPTGAGHGRPPPGPHHGHPHPMLAPAGLGVHRLGGGNSKRSRARDAPYGSSLDDPHNGIGKWK